MNYQGLLWNVHCIATVVLRKQLNFKIAVIRSKRSCFFSFVGDQTQTFSRPNFESRNLWFLFDKSCWNINTQTMLRILFSLLCVKYILLVLSKGIINTLNECSDVTAFTFATWRGGHGGVLNTATPQKKLTNTASPQEKSTKHRHRNTYFQRHDSFIYT